MYSNDDYLLQLLTDAGLITEDDVQSAQQGAKGHNTALDILVDNFKVSEEDVAQTMAANSGTEYINLEEWVPEPEALDKMNADVAGRFKAVPVNIDGGTLLVAVADPFDVESMDSLGHVVPGMAIDFRTAPLGQVKALLTEFYGVSFEADDGELVLDDPGGEEDAPIIKMVQEMLNEALQTRSSDIHIEPLETYLRIRYRIDGAMHEVAQHPLKLHGPIMARLKIMTGSMSIDEKRIPQDGRIQVKLGKKEIDLRVSTIPTNHGESVVMRILDKSGLMLGLPQLGFLSDDEDAFRELINLPDGIIMVTGPTGSGKTTTLYSCLNEINKPDRKIITVEDPVEYQLAGINQVPVKESIGMTFAAALRSMLRQAPNIVMIGEIRDMETAGIAINAALTGHLVFSTLHTNDAPSAVARLADIGIKPFLTASAVRAIQAQRLVRKLCDDCKEPADLEEKERRALNIDVGQMANATIMKGTGCKKCRNTGYRGRMCIIEIFEIDDQAREMITHDLTTPQLKKQARENGMRTLREDGIRKMLAGYTTASEVIRSSSGDFD